VQLETVPNPYNFTAPVLSKDFFVGRREERAEIDYYLEYARCSKRPIHVAILGKRASGKSSLLNLTEDAAKSKHFSTTRIDLDEGDLANQLAFLYKVFDGVLNAACEEGAYGGLTSGTYQTYLQLVSAFAEAPPGLDTFPFVFPVQYAAAKRSRQSDAQVSETALRRDLGSINAALGRPMLLLVDEASAIAQSTIHLQKVRNVLMTVPGLMLMLAGTLEMLAAMGDAFSPIVRQFKKITLGPYKTVNETDELVRLPLQESGIIPDEIFDFDTKAQVREIHALTGGRPYEIQLICHMLFRRVQQKRAGAMKIDYGALEEVRRELETYPGWERHEALAEICGFDKGQLAALGVLGNCNGTATLDQLWSVHYIIGGTLGREDLQRYQTEFMSRSVFNERDGKLFFVGDEFDKIYAKYLAREHGIDARFFERGPHEFLSSQLRQHLDKFQKLRSLCGPENLSERYRSAARELFDPDSTEDVFVAQESAVEDLYFLAVEYASQSSIPVAVLTLALPWVIQEYIFFFEFPQGLEGMPELVGELRELIPRVEHLGGRANVEEKGFSGGDFGVVRRKLKESSNQRLRIRIAHNHVFRMAERYLADDTARALNHAHEAYEYREVLIGPALTNLGYVLMAGGEHSLAREVLESALAREYKPLYPALPLYDLAVLEAKEGRLQESLGRLDECLECLAGVPANRTVCLCVFVLSRKGDSLEVFEMRLVPNIVRVAQDARSTIEAILSDRAAMTGR
jgi:tetratricopeptide (TPR) repeat protein